MKTHHHLRNVIQLTTIIGLAFTLSACGKGGWWSNDETKSLNEDQIRKLIPARVNDRASWAKDIASITNTLKIENSKENICSIIAIVDQESNFVANPNVPGLGQKAVKEVSNRLQEKFEDKLGETLGGPLANYFNDVLRTQPSVEDNYLKQMSKVKNEQQLDVLYREIFEYMSQHYHVSALTGAAKLVGQDLAEKMNPITTLGSMQVHINYAKEHKRNSMNNNELRDDLYTQYGGLYYGIHRLMLYPAAYDKAIYRFADYNSGMYSSRNAAVQKMVEKLTGIDLSLDGDLLSYDKNAKPLIAATSSEKAINTLFITNKVLITPRQIRNDLKDEKSADFEKTQTYLAISKLYQEKTGKNPIYAIMPEVVISGPKLSRDYNTNWYASRVNGRFETCMQRAKHIKI
ncbi:DUF1615 domain-containing protein [Acinetobacter rudis]|uniref:DUF1615 domain-containing protein n=1 Tax=Acinetobacter rudis TaxID=632955 RepID=A0AAW8J4V2_9GAMM|nr:DUF1615 domain-containing protein [Acinetobacter rudis]MDQ8934363.1 DUF1615 domain-containing protein [Acinetobacter rudis]MDQ8951999.1 DUF1615 domain-containing protein [Acinetobacter rudis]MDQ9016737.1 DUF1615 domain-containing protein [Acinetobacter rudis]